MATCVFTSTSITGTNTDKKRDGAITATFSRTSGTQPPSGSTLQKVTVYFSNITVYATTSAGFSTVYGDVSLDLSSGAHTCQMSNPSASILNFTGGSITFTVTGGSSTSSNVLNVRSGSTITITIEYDLTAASTGSLSTTSVYPGGEITLYINEASPSYSHSVTWYRDASHQYSETLGDTSSTTYKIPTTWPTGSATVTLYSRLANGTLIGSNSYSFSITTNPSTLVPTAGTLSVGLSQSSYVPSSWGVYVKGFSQAFFSLSGASPGSNSTFKSITFSCGTRSITTPSTTTWFTGALLETGTLTCSASVTNMAGNTATAASRSITVYDYSPPSFTSVTAFRCLSNGTPSDTGAYFSVTASVTISSVNGKNSLVALQARFAPVGSSSWSSATTITNGRQTIIGGSATGSGKYQVQVIAIDAIQNLQNTNSNMTVSAITSEHVIYCMDGGLNVSIGKEGTRQRAFEINPDWQIWHGDTRLDGTVPVTRGGTGATDATTARNNLGAAAASHKHSGADINSGVVDALYGGTGANNAADARKNLGITPANIGAVHAGGGVGQYTNLVYIGWTGWDLKATVDVTDIGYFAMRDKNTALLPMSVLPFKVQYGTIALSGASWATVSLSGFTGTPVVVATFTDDSTSSGVYSLKTRNRSSTGFEICMSGSASGSRSACWIAIGT